MSLMSSPPLMYEDVTAVLSTLISSTVYKLWHSHSFNSRFYSKAAALASGVMDKLEQPGHFTLFAPTNEAFGKLSPGPLKRLMGDKTIIKGGCFDIEKNACVHFLRLRNVVLKFSDLYDQFS